MIYFDQAASSFPKPKGVGKAMLHALNEIGANPGRGSHQSARNAASIIQETRERASRLFGCTDPKKALFYSNATTALNQAIKGFPWSRGDHIIATSFEHNSIRRPLEYIRKQKGITITYLQWNGDTEKFIIDLEDAVTSKTKLIAMTHASNVTGTILPIEKVSKVARRNSIKTLLDGSQTAGHIPINMVRQDIDMLVFPGHKGLLGPQGTGMLLVEGDIELEPIHHGGTGAYSELIGQPEQWPEKYESGTLNTPGIAGLNAALTLLEGRSMENVPRETLLAKQLLKGLKSIPGIVCYGPQEHESRMPIVAFNINDIPSQEIAMVLDTHYNIAVRAGLHCSPLGHETLNTTEQGAVRASIGMYNTEEEVNFFIKAIQEIVSAYEDL
ncbi:aminotransferase class V-fold PLP-dependent enzyme [Virgibacillus siamensis]|uniref:aminotransferase class V-fold PLP-dependent enzyme n=1 Tax=Virgibacillus siamensis TaxID=480071 RepID=UPI000985DBCB|nr:aminotransferase class V-fold PLP-dependent enzyme [Virgibacillus siamensis]